MNLSEKQEALENSLKTLGFAEDYIIHLADARCGEKFAIAQKAESGGINIQSEFYSYEEMNAFFTGLLRAWQDKFGLGFVGRSEVKDLQEQVRRYRKVSKMLSDLMEQTKGTPIRLQSGKSEGTIDLSGEQATAFRAGLLTAIELLQDERSVTIQERELS